MVSEASVFKSEKEMADELLAKLELPPEVVRISTDLGTDTSGDDAIFVHLHIARDAINQKYMVRKLANFSEQVQILLLGSGITRFPYVYIEEAA
jgi:hypothetical protein